MSGRAPILRARLRLFIVDERAHNRRYLLILEFKMQTQLKNFFSLGMMKYSNELE